jgi:hypothetical protein
VLRYRAGALHSTGGNPAMVVPPNQEERTEAFTRGDLYIQYQSFLGFKYGFGPQRRLYSTERRWYAQGELHRDYGPAIEGDDYWCKYYCGVRAATDANTYTKSLSFEPGWPQQSGRDVACARLWAPWAKYEYAIAILHQSTDRPCANTCDRTLVPGLAVYVPPWPLANSAARLAFTALRQLSDDCF